VVGIQGALLGTTNGGATWTPQNLSTSTYLMDVTFISGTTGWAVGFTLSPTCSTILRTTDSGATWTPQSTGAALGLNGVRFASPTRGWAVGDSGTILATTTGGN
jgi:photosystem II stability/assembly factor-like uncharacterized protein